MPLSNRSRRLSVAPVAHLERRGRGSLGGGSSSERLSHSFPEDSHFIRGTHPLYGLLPPHHPGQSLGAGGGVSAPEGSHRAGSASFAGLLQPFVCRHEGLGVVAASNRSLAFEPQSAQGTVQDGDSLIRSVVSPQGGLDGLHLPEGCISASSDASGIQKVSSVHGVRQSLPIQGSLLWSVHGSAGLHAGDGSGFGDSPQSWNSALALSGRLADSGVLPRAGSSCSEDGPPVVQLSGDSRQLGEVSACADSEDDLPRSPVGLCQFPGFSSPETSRQASLNWRRVSVLRKSACEILVRVAGGAVLSDSAHSGGTAADAVVPVCPSSGLGPLKSRSSCAVVSGDPPGSSLVVGPRAARARHLARAGVSPTRLVVRRFRCRLESAPRRGGSFRPLVSRRAAQLHQSSRAVSNFLCAPAFSSACSELRSGGVCGRHDSADLPAESGGHQICGFKPDGSGSSALGGAPFHLPSASVHHGAQQRVGRFSLSSKSDSGFRVDPETVCVSAASEKVAGVNRPLFRQNTYLQNKKHTLTCQGGTGCYRFNYQPGS